MNKCLGLIIEVCFLLLFVSFALLNICSPLILHARHATILLVHTTPIVFTRQDNNRELWWCAFATFVLLLFVE